MPRVILAAMTCSFLRIQVPFRRCATARATGHRPLLMPNSKQSGCDPFLPQDVTPFCLSVNRSGISLTSLLLGLTGCSCCSPIMGGFSRVSVNDKDVIATAEFAVRTQQQLMKPSKISLVKIERARQQLVAGMNYFVDLKVNVDGDTKRARAVVWHKLDGEHELTSWTWR